MTAIGVGLAALACTGSGRQDHESSSSRLRTCRGNRYLRLRTWYPRDFLPQVSVSNVGIGRGMENSLRSRVC